METPGPSVPNEFRERLARAMGPGYELRGLLGRGGFGDVFSAWDVRLKRGIAVKALRGDPRFQRVVRESRSPGVTE